MILNQASPGEEATVQSGEKKVSDGVKYMTQARLHRIQ